MADIISAVVGVMSAVFDVGSCSVGPIRRQFMYLYNYRTNFDKLEQEARKLELVRDRVKRKVDDAENNLGKIEQNVKDWQNKVKKIIDDAEELIRKKANNRCFKGFCPNLMTRYKHGKEALRKGEDIAQLLQEETTFRDVSHPTTHKDIRLINKGFEEFETRRSNLDDVLNALKDAKVGMVGVYGMGGIGKTTLVREVGKVAEEGKLFEKVIFLEVTDTPDIKKIQDDIANNLGLQFNNETERANKMYERLKNGQKILLILDNIWENLILGKDNIWETVGIPVGVDRGGCKLLLTARDVKVLSNMESEKNIRMGILNEEEAWRLFLKKIAGDFVGQGELKSLAEEVCKKCGGLPIAIVTVAKALSNKRDPSIWRAALEQFKRPSPENFEGDLKLPYLSIELSYKSLRGKELQKTFLLCSLMGYEASILDLLKYAMGLNIFEDICTMQKARDRACKFISELKDSCLLLEGHTSESFSMHDFVREVAITIAKRDNHVFSVRNDTDQWEWPGRDKQKNFTKIFIRDSTISGLHEELKCPKLESFFINTKVSDYQLMRGDYEVVEIPQKFFTGMTELKVLDLTTIQLCSLRLSLHLLKDLQTLCLDFCKFEDVAFIGELECLKILSLHGSIVEELPREIAQLTKLRLLDLSNCRQLKVIAPKVISSLLQLEELYMSGCFVEWETEVHNVKRSNASLDELKHLSKLTTLELDIKDDKILPQGLFSKELKKYKISIGDGSSAFGGWYILDDLGKSVHIDSFNFTGQSTFRTLRTLKLKHNSILCLEELRGFNNVEFLCLDKLEGVKNVLYELNKEGFSELKHLHVHNNPNLLCIVDTKGPHNAFPALESLILFNLIKLDTIYFGQPKETSFQNLKVIEVQACGRLKHLFSFSNIAKSLPQLQRIYVNDCPNMEEIFAIESEDNVNNHNEILAIESEDNVSNHNEINLCQLRIVSLKRLSRLASFCSELKTHSTSQRREMESMPLFNEKVVFPNLEDLNLYGMNIEKIWDSKLQTIMSYFCQHLTSLTICGCHKLKYVFPSSMVESLKQLQRLQIINCKVLEEIVLKGGADQAFSNIAKSLPQLQRIYVNDCPNMKEIFAIESEDNVSNNKEILAIESEDNVSNHNEINLCQLRFLTLSYLPRLASFCSEVKTHSTSQRREMESMPLFNEKVVFPNLEVLNLEKVNMEKIWDNQLSTSMSSSSQNLTSLTIYGCEKLKYIFPFFMVESLKQLQNLDIRNCKVLEEIFSEGEREKEDAKVEWPKLKKLMVWNCERLEICTLEDKVVFPNLEDLNLYGISIEKIWDSKLQTIMSSFYQNLTRLAIWRCEKLKYVFPSSMVESLKQLQHLEISRCKVLEEIVLKGGADQAIVKFEFPQVTSLKLRLLPDLTAFYLGTHTSEWPMLKELDVYKCDKLQIFTSEYKFVSPNLEHLILNGIDSELTTLHISKWPMLKKLGVCDCAKVKIFYEGQPDKPQSLVSHEKMNHNLEELILGGKSIMMIRRGLFPENLLCRIKVFEIQDDKSANIPLEIVQRFNNLEKLRLNNSSYKEMLSCGEEVTHTGILAQIKGLELCWLSYMKYLWKQDSNRYSLLQNLESLEVSFCEILINVVPPLASFQNLTVLKVWVCNRMMNVITSSTAKSLGQLREMEIIGCKMLIEIVENGGDAAKEVIDFSKLEKLSLQNLESLTCFCFGNYTFNFPSLENLIVYNCPKMKTFFEGDLSTPTLKFTRVEGCWEGDLNTTIQQLHKRRINSNLEELTLSGRDITPMWQGQLPENFCELKVLEVIKDESANIPIGILQRFNNLEQLILKGSSYKEMFSCGDDVKNVGMLTHIKILKLWGLFNLKNMWKQDPQLLILQNLETLKVQCCHSMINLLPSSASFGNLITLKVQCCDGLINMLTSSMAKTLVQLEKMKVRHCEIMTDIVANQGDEEKGEIVFNKLKSMSLENLASLTHFGFGNYTIKFPALEELIVVKCPKMGTFFGGILSTPSLKKVQKSQFDFEGCWEGDLNTTLQHLHRNEY